MLIHLISDYIRDHNIREKFGHDPEGVIKHYQIPAHVLPHIRGRNLPGIMRALQHELEATGHHHLPGMKVMAWGGGGITVETVTPDNGPIHTNIPLKVTGMFFPGDALLVLALSTDPSVYFQATGTHVVVQPNGQSLMTGTVNVGRVGTYDVLVLSSDKQKGGMAQNGFRAHT